MKWMGRWGGEKGKAEAKDYNYKKQQDELNISLKASGLDSANASQLRDAGLDGSYTDDKGNKVSINKKAQAAAFLEAAQMGAFKVGDEAKAKTMMGDLAERSPELWVKAANAMKKTGPDDLTREVFYTDKNGVFQQDKYLADQAAGKVGVGVLKNVDPTAKLATMEEMAKRVQDKAGLEKIWKQLDETEKEDLKSHFDSSKFVDATGNFDEARALTFAEVTGSRKVYQDKAGNWVAATAGLRNKAGVVIDGEKLAEKFTNKNPDAVAKGVNFQELENGDMATQMANKFSVPQLETIASRGTEYQKSFRKGLLDGLEKLENSLKNRLVNPAEHKKLREKILKAYLVSGGEAGTQESFDGGQTFHKTFNDENENADVLCNMTDKAVGRMDPSKVSAKGLTVMLSRLSANKIFGYSQTNNRLFNALINQAVTDAIAVSNRDINKPAGVAIKSTLQALIKSGISDRRLIDQAKRFGIKVTI